MATPRKRKPRDCPDLETVRANSLFPVWQQIIELSNESLSYEKERERHKQEFQAMGLDFESIIGPTVDEFSRECANAFLVRFGRDYADGQDALKEFIKIIQSLLSEFESGAGKRHALIDDLLKARAPWPVIAALLNAHRWDSLSQIKRRKVIHKIRESQNNYNKKYVRDESGLYVRKEKSKP